MLRHAAYVLCVISSTVPRRQRPVHLLTRTDGVLTCVDDCVDALALYGEPLLVHAVFDAAAAALRNASERDLTFSGIKAIERREHVHAAVVVRGVIGAIDASEHELVLVDVKNFLRVGAGQLRAAACAFRGRLAHVSLIYDIESGVDDILRFICQRTRYAVCAAHFCECAAVMLLYYKANTAFIL